MKINNDHFPKNNKYEECWVNFSSTAKQARYMGCASANNPSQKKKRKKAVTNFKLH